MASWVLATSLYVAPGTLEAVNGPRHRIRGAPFGKVGDYSFGASYVVIEAA